MRKLTDSPEVTSSCLTAIASIFKSKPLPEDSEIDPIDIFTQFNSAKRLNSLRALMRENNISAYIIPSEDEHQSEYTALKDQRREYISGFSGTSGIAVVTLHSAALSTDSRYFLQAEKQLDENWILLKQGVCGYPSWIDWLVDECVYGMDQLDEVGSVGVDPRLITWKLGNELVSKCHDNNITFVNDLDHNLIDLIRGKQEANKGKLYKYELKYAGLHTTKKIEKLRSQMAEHGYFVYVSSMLDSIAWLLNLRGNDISFNPVFFAYLVITMDSVVLYVDKVKMNSEISAYLSELQIRTKPYTSIWDELPALKGDGCICLEKNASYSIFINVPQVYEIVFRSIITELKGVKNEIEVANIQESQKIDSLAIVRFLSWFNLNKCNTSLNELDLVDKLYEFRRKSEHFRGLSFATIIASGANASIVHYEPTEDSFSLVKHNDVLLIDSGGQYFQGTTDITRTIYVNNGKPPSKELKRAYTLVLKGHLNVAMLKFHKGKSSYEIDRLAREPLLKYGMNYGHGTGHGIDNFICVHAGPCGLSPSATSYNYKPLEKGNFISDEPGYYKDGHFGIRIESDILVNEEQDMLKFEYFTLVPFCRELIETKYLSNAQVDWINAYHKRIYTELSTQLENVKDFGALDWLADETKAL
ncbi:hypothetical protein JL09_g1709 [Pichia kudriavzevii]|uniref:Xaa-Pro aminopeptidase P n=1 Tax=Pichia kudriavzevii TaxID=4909 RepID=A0A099P2H9_PICKU|nr:hypothetical protein JL09_g1709 [Pichia kudriavzevii]